jgi:uncharacterized protein YbjT (DUF2867 family)
MGKTALLAGGSGLIGGHCLEFLLKDATYDRVHVLVRQPLGVVSDKLIQHVGSLEILEQTMENFGIDDVFCCLGTTLKKAGSKEAFRVVDFDYPFRIAKKAKSIGATGFYLVSALGADPESKFFYNRVKGDVERAVADCGFERYAIFRPSLLVGKRKERRPAEEWSGMLARCLSFVFIGPMKRFRPVAAAAVALAMVSAAKETVPGVRVYESVRIHAMADSMIGA